MLADFRNFELKGILAALFARFAAHFGGIFAVCFVFFQFKCLELFDCLIYGAFVGS